ncbi:succinate dehydrogenase subunit 6 mitochondrial [Prunus yedoensis var. nudiflora]|uniref:Succinate dehydrogenase subunit 6 mitochondrial n=1 Tax=Prunus yedoensis var. nudiflora TaxID=2094558 RepID=A0A314XJY4_PRUYE|nr:succinate dehydrogenase subunit 6 mitochondrial [Prunus yedoensis var. nudiflora]
MDKVRIEEVHSTAKKQRIAAHTHIKGLGLEVLLPQQLLEVKRDKPLPPWSESDVEAFIAFDPVHGPALKTAREAVNFGLTGSVIGAVSTASFTWKYSRSLHGAGLSFLAGGVFGWTFGQEIANHWLQLYRLNTLAAQTKFLKWWEDKNERRS